MVNQPNFYAGSVLRGGDLNPKGIDVDSTITKSESHGGLFCSPQESYEA
jgi:hypothetical protein